ncbi:hypothetical protein CKA34_07510 [Rhizobium sp. 11515TR]|nr:hypothetical protein CKA34_07510 [Rhizobium sp. 11515TR]
MVASIRCLGPVPIESPFSILSGATTPASPKSQGEIAPRLLHVRGYALEQFQEKCAAVFRQELRKNKEVEHFRDSKKSATALSASHLTMRAESLTIEMRQRLAVMLRRPEEASRSTRGMCLTAS